MVTNVFQLAGISLNGSGNSRRPTLLELRLAAAEQGADALLVVNAVHDQDRYVNPLSLLYITIIGYYLVPGSNLDVLTMLDTAVIDVGNGYIYVGAQSEGTFSSIRPGAYIDYEGAKIEATKKAFKALGENLVE